MRVEEMISLAKVIRSSRRTLAMEIRNGELLIRAPRFAGRRDIEKFIRKNAAWIEKQIIKSENRQKLLKEVDPLTPEQIKELADEAKKVVPPRVDLYAQKLNVTYGRITIRCQKTRWGSCSAKGNLNFNCLLMLAPPQVLDSVVVHELCHRIEMNHSPRFYSEIEKVFPDYRKWNRWLKDNGKILMARAGRI